MPMDGPAADPPEGLGNAPAAEPLALLPTEPPADSATPGLNAGSTSRSRPDIIPWLIAVGVFAAYTTISVGRLVRRTPGSWDMGIFTEYVKQFAHLRAPIVDIRGPGVNLLGDHFHPIVALIAPFFWVFPTPVTLLVAQALLAAASVVPVCRAGAELLGPGYGRAIGAAYGFSWGLQQMVNTDFHEIAFAVPLLAFALSAMVRGRQRAAVLWALPLVLVKEDQGFTLVAIGLIIAFAYRRRGLGFFLAGWGLLWSLLAILVIIPHFNAQHVYAYWRMGGGVSSAGGHLSVGGLWTSLSTDASTKLSTLALILAATAFLAVRSPVVLAAVPGLALRFVSNNSAFWGTGWHYNATVMPIVFIAAIDALARMRAGRPARRKLAHMPRFAWERYGAAAMLIICAVLGARFPLSSLWSSASYQLGPHVAAENQAISRVPDGATVATGLDLLAPLAARADAFWLGNSNPPTQYVVFDADNSDFQPPPINVPAFIDQIAHSSKYREVYFNDGVYVFRRAA